MISLSVGVGNSAAAARDAFMAMLYAKHGMLRDTLVNIYRHPDPNNTVALLRDNTLADQGDSRPYVGVAVILANGHVMVFVKPKYRRQGWGAQLVAAARATTLVDKRRFFSRPGDDLEGSSDFWNSVGIECRQLDEPMRLRQSEVDQLHKDNKCLIYRAVDKVPLQVYEEIYLHRLFNTDYSEKHDGLQGHLHAILSHEWHPADFVLFHLHQEAVSKINEFVRIHQIYDSFATVNLQIEDTSEGVVDVAHIQIFVAPDKRRLGYGQEIIDLIRKRLPKHRLKGYYTPSARSLYARNNISDLNRNAS